MHEVRFDLLFVFVLVVFDCYYDLFFSRCRHMVLGVYKTSGHLNRAVRPAKGKSAPKH
jgi:hypothetical protein